MSAKLTNEQIEAVSEWIEENFAKWLADCFKEDFKQTEPNYINSNLPKSIINSPDNINSTKPFGYNDFTVVDHETVKETFEDKVLSHLEAINAKL